jgi:hypothetical protein
VRCALSSKNFFFLTRKAVLGEVRAQTHEIFEHGSEKFVEARVRSQVSLLEICGGQNDTGTDFSPHDFNFPLSVSYRQFSILIFIYMFLLPEGQTSKAWESSKKQCSFGNGGALERGVVLLVSEHLSHGGLSS